MEDIYRPRKRKREDVMGKENIHPNIMGESLTKGILNTKEIEIESKILVMFQEWTIYKLHF